MSTIIIDTETTGLSHRNDEVLEISIINQDGDILLDTLIQPVKKTEWPEAQAIHGISPEMIKASNAPTLQALAPTIANIINESDQVVAYNVAYDKPFLNDAFGLTPITSGMPLGVIEVLCGTGSPIPWVCSMEKFAEAYGEWDERRDQFKWQKLTTAAEHVGHVWQGDAHRSLADCQATLSVWKWLQKSINTAAA